MSCGAGRGRGWLNLARNQATQRPGGMSYSPGDISSPQMPTNDDTANFADPAPSEHAELISRVKQLSLMDDGITFNQKIKFILEYWRNECNTKEDVEASFDSLYNASSLNTELASKLVLMVASNTFIKQEVSEQNIRHLFLQRLQSNFESANQLQTANPVVFRNSVHMLGEFYHKARLVNGDVYKFLAVPFISSLEMLLDCKTVPEVSLFAAQLYLNGSTIKYEKPEETSTILTKVRTILVGEPGLLRETKLWLLLTLDLSNNKFGILPTDVYKFYESQLGSAALVNFQKSHDALSVQTVHSSKILDSYQSPVNVLQISTPQESTNSETTSQFNNVSQYIDRLPSGLPSEYSQSISGKDNFNKNKDKPGRPILGAGARLGTNKSKEDGKLTWKDPGENSTGWNNKHKNTGSHWGDGKKAAPTFKSNKGWEHDDRFDNDYS